MAFTLSDKLVVAISSRALFQLEEEHALFSSTDARTYRELQWQRLEQAAAPGTAFALINKLLAFNADGQHRVEVVILSRNDPVSGLRIFRSAKAAGLPLERGVFTCGRPAYPYLGPLQADLFLSADAEDVRQALEAGFPAARVFPQSMLASTAHPGEIRIAFDGDAVLFSDEAERIYQHSGLPAFHQHEASRAGHALPAGPFKPFLHALHALQNEASQPGMRIRTALVTARSAPAHERAIRTLMSWQIEVDEAMFLGGLDKTPFLHEFAPDFYFDDQTGHCLAGQHAVPTGQVIHGVMHERAPQD